MRLVTSNFRDATLSACLAFVLVAATDVVAQSHDTPAAATAPVKVVPSEHAAPVNAAIPDTAASASPPPTTGKDPDPSRGAKVMAHPVAARPAASSVSATGRGRPSVASARRGLRYTVRWPSAAVRWELAWPAAAVGVRLSWPQQDGDVLALNSAQIAPQIP